MKSFCSSKDGPAQSSATYFNVQTSWFIIENISSGVITRDIFALEELLIAVTKGIPSPKGNIDYIFLECFPVGHSLVGIVRFLQLECMGLILSQLFNREKYEKYSDY